jgi:hypothetical protein
VQSPRAPLCLVPMTLEPNKEKCRKFPRNFFGESYEFIDKTVAQGEIAYFSWDGEFRLAVSHIRKFVTSLSETFYVTSRLYPIM